MVEMISGSSSLEELKKSLEKVLFSHGKSKRLICYAVPRTYYVPVPYPPGREKVMTHEYVHAIDIEPGGGRLDVQISTLLNLPGCQEPFETHVYTFTTWGEFFEWLQEFVKNNFITIIEVEKTIRETVWVNKSLL